MSLTLILYFFVLILLGYILFLIYQKRVGYIYEKYLSVWMLFIFLWVWFYILLFLFKSDSWIDVYRVRVLYALGFLVLYTMLGFFYFYWVYNKKSTQKQKIFHSVFIVFLTGITLLVMATSKVVIDIEYNIETGVSTDILWPWYGLISWLNALSLVFLIGIIIYRSSRLSGISKLRYRNIALGYYITMFLMVFCLSVLPIFDIWIFEQEQILFFIPFLLGILYSIYRYKFKKVSFGVWRAIIFLFSLGFSLFIVFAMKKIFGLMDYSFARFWNLSSIISLWDIVIANIVFYTTHRYFQSQFQLHYNSSFRLQNKLNNMKSRIPFLQTHDQLNMFLQSEFSSKLNIKYTHVFQWNSMNNISEIVNFFSEENMHWFFFNDRVFIEENKHKMDYKNILQQLDSKYILYIPMYKNKNELLWIFAIGKKSFNDYYQSFEIEMFEDFSNFLVGHLTYINIYSKIYELNLTLDKKVDEKTIEYNNLINKQKEFIWYVWHEIRNPITNTIFLCYDLQQSIIKAVKDKKLSQDIKEDIDILSDELKKVSDLSKNIFHSEKMDLWKVKLYKQKINLKEFILSEITTLESLHPGIVFNTDMSDVWKVEIDEVQFRQVIANLLWNAIKFVPKNKWKILTRLSYVDDNIKITIEDNGKWFNDIDNKNVFDKYNTWNHEASWLGMWLYLCKKIVELHNGTIHSASSDITGWAKFTIIL